MLYLVMRYVDGLDLREILRREGALSADRAVSLVAQIASALDSAHALGLVHRDVKPGNVLVGQTDAGEHAYLCDFGLARHLASVESLTGERAFVGTIAYISPEQIQGAAIDGRADVYSLGCLLFECLTGQAPFERESEVATVYAHMNEPPPRAGDVRPGIPAGFDDVVARALAKAPDDRYASCGELARGGRGRAPRRAAARRPAAPAARTRRAGGDDRRGRGRDGRHPPHGAAVGTARGTATRDRAQDDGSHRCQDPQARRKRRARRPAVGRRVRCASGVGAARRRSPRRARRPRLAQGALVDEAPLRSGRHRDGRRARPG